MAGDIGQRGPRVPRLIWRVRQLSPQPDGTDCEEDHANEWTSGPGARNLQKVVEEPGVGRAILGLRRTPARYRAVPVKVLSAISAFVYEEMRIMLPLIASEPRIPARS